MTSDFWAGYISGAVGICVGNPLDVVKVQLQVGQYASIVSSNVLIGRKAAGPLLKGAAAPILAYGALNSLLFMTYNRSLKRLDPSITEPTKLHHVSLYRIWEAGAIGGLASWVVSAPSELIKCRTQLHVGAKTTNSLIIFKHVWSRYGLQGLYLGGSVTCLRDSVGYGFYFSSYELCRRLFASQRAASGPAAATFDVLVSGGIAGIITWASIYPLDVIKTRIQAEGWRDGQSQRSHFAKSSSLGMARNIFEREGPKAFYRGLAICSVRAFFVNAIQWYAYEKIMALFASLNPPQAGPISADSMPFSDP